MKIFRCIKPYFIHESDGNQEIPCLIAYGQIFIVADFDDLPDNWVGKRDLNFEELSVKDLVVAFK